MTASNIIAPNRTASNSRKIRAFNKKKKPNKRVLKAIAKVNHVRLRLKRNYDYAKLLCLYDGIKLRSTDQEYIEWLQLPEQREKFDLKPTYNHNGVAKLYLKGKFKNIDIEIRRSRKSGWLVYFHGSVHKLFNILSKDEEHNHNDFYWNDFVWVYDEMIRIFQFDPTEVDVVNLEGGVNCKLAGIIKLTVPEIMESILSLFGVFKNKSWIQDTDRDTFKVCRGERYLKFYDKSVQNGLEEAVERMELGYERARQIIKDLHVHSFHDLTKLETLFYLTYELIEAFKTLHTFHPDLFNLPIAELVAENDIFKYSKPSFWSTLKKGNKYQYEQKRKHLDELIKRYCSYNLSTELLTMLVEKLS
jgi:hypothetical protein